MPLDYTDGADPFVNDVSVPVQETDKQIQNVDPINSSGDKVNTVEFDHTSEAAYDAIAAEYPNAWDTYYDDGISPAPAYSLENADKLQTAVNFYLYVNPEARLEEEFLQTPSLDSVDLAPYIREEGSSVGTYENPDAFYDEDVYDRVTSGGTVALPRVELDGSRTINAKADSGRDVDFAQLFSSEQLNSTEYETVRKGPRSAYDWGGAYASGKNTY